MVDIVVVDTVVYLAKVLTHMKPARTHTHTEILLDSVTRMHYSACATNNSPIHCLNFSSISQCCSKLETDVKHDRAVCALEHGCTSAGFS
jgi:hypothetical protein